jgi:hypothetical protein
MLKIILLSCILFSCNANADNENTDSLNYGAALYGISYHTKDRQSMNETNLGVALYATKEIDKHRFVGEIGTFENSFYDQAYWLGAQYTYRIFSHLELGAMLRHWETDHNTYEKRLLYCYGLASIKLNEELRLSAILRPSGYIAFISFDF